MQEPTQIMAGNANEREFSSIGLTKVVLPIDGPGQNSLKTEKK